ncbi:MAG TPA: hypothetical protein VIT93_03790 [Dehalococcoidia bacterium]
MREKARLARTSLIAVLMLAAVAACSSQSTGENEGSPLNTASASPGRLSSADFRLPEGPSLANVTFTAAPSYLFLFTHTEDQFNHDLSEERYWRLGSVMEEIAADYPDLGMTWTIEFQGADAETVLNRNSETGLADYLLSLKDRGLVEFGYLTLSIPAASRFHKR